MDEWEDLESSPLPQEESDGGKSAATSSSTPAPGVAGSRQPAGRPLTRELLLKALLVSKPAPAARQHKEDSQLEKLLAKQTHLHLNNLQLNSLVGLADMPQLETLYLYDNQLEDVGPLSALTTLTALYLQNNCIFNLAPLQPLYDLHKLYLEGNCISHVSGLCGLSALEELHLSNQRLPAGQGLVLEPGCLAPSLRVLSAMNCGLRDNSLEALQGLPELRKLELAGNQLQALDGPLEQVLRVAARLLSLDLRNNPMSRIPRYRESVIVMSDSIALLDGVAVTPQQREVLIRLQIKRLKAQLHADQEGPQQQQQRSHDGRAQQQHIGAGLGVPHGSDFGQVHAPAAAAGPGALQQHRQGQQQQQQQQQQQVGGRSAGAALKRQASCPSAASGPASGRVTPLMPSLPAVSHSHPPRQPQARPAAGREAAGKAAAVALDLQGLQIRPAT